MPLGLSPGRTHKKPRAQPQVYIYSQLISTIILCSLISAVGVYIVGEILFGYLYDRARSSAFSTENHDIALFNSIAGNLEAKARPIGAVPSSSSGALFVARLARRRDA